jgi:hypothetical protein
MPITNIAGIVCILTLMFFFPIAHGIGRLICWAVLASTSTSNRNKKGAN